MAEDDIYGSQGRYEHLKSHLKEFGRPPPRAEGGRRTKRKYVCKNVENLKYFEVLFATFESKDTSFIRRNRLLQSMRLLCHLTPKDLRQCTRDDVSRIAAGMHQVYSSSKSKQTFIKDVRHIWKILFPEKDSQGRPDETIVPYVVRHLVVKIDKSRERMRDDRMTWREFERIVSYFAGDPRIQAYLTLSMESLARPQELLYVRIRNVELHDNYARVYIAEHGKEGVGLLQCIDSYPYLLKWLSVHPLGGNPDAFLFVNVGNTNRCRQLTPANINKMIRRACADLGITKPLTCYSLKRNGVTIRRLRGESDMEIQHAARWTSTKQLKTYDLSTQDEAFKRELEKRGLLPTSDPKEFRSRKCEFCSGSAGFGELLCRTCRRPLDRTVIRKELKEKNSEVAALKKSVADIASAMQDLRRHVLQHLAGEIRAAHLQPAVEPSRQPGPGAPESETALASPSIDVQA